MATTSSSTSATSPTAMNAMNTLRMTGLASGMDTESMVNSLMKAEQAKYDKLAQKKTMMDWKSDANLEVNNLLKDFRDTYLSLLNSDTSMMSSSSVLAFKVTADSTSNATITATSQALAGTHQINSITSLASGASAKSSGTISASALTASTKLSSLALTNGLTFGSDGKLSFAINGETFTFNSSDTLQDVFNKVNGDTTANVSMSYSSLTGKISIASKALGSSSSLKIDNLSGNAFDDSNAAFGIAQGTFANGTDAQLNIDGVDVTKSTNSFTIDGISYNLKYTTNTPIKFSVDQDVDGAVDRVKKFVTAYNTLIDKLQSKLDEKADSSYQPLTDDQKSSMSEAQITQWETKAKTGLLQNDSYVSKLLSDMRKSFFDNVSGAGTNATAIGLSTMSYLTQGEIYVDEPKLRQALQNNPQQVSQVLTKSFVDSSPSVQYSNSGTISRISDTVNRYLNDYSGYRQTSTNAQYSDLTDSMTKEQTRLQDKEDRYWNQFTRMEEALSKMNTQSSWLSQQFSSSKS